MEQERAARGSRSQRRCPLRIFIYTVPENPMDSAPLHPRCPSQGKEGNKGGKGTQKGQGTLESKREKKSCLVIFLSFLERVLTPLQAPHMLVFHCQMAELENLPN